MTARNDPFVDVSSSSYELYADFYDRYATVMTQPHAIDLIGLAEPKIRQAKRILELGCGSGVFGLAYQSQFPHGIEGQTIVCTDVSPAMVELARQRMVGTSNSSSSSSSSSSRTVFTFQVADATNLHEFHDKSFDMVVSVFGIFLVPDQPAVLREVRRVLKEGGTLAATSWTTTSCNQELKDAGFGTNFHDVWGSLKAATLPSDATVPPGPLATPPPLAVDWFDRGSIRSFLSANQVFEEVTIRHALHSTTFSNVEHLWAAITTSNPFGAAFANQEPEQVVQAKARLVQTVTGPSAEGESVVFTFMASNLVLAS